MLAICHTYFSLRTGVRSPAEWAAAAKRMGYRALAVADINGLFGAVEFYQEVEKVGLYPLIGAGVTTRTGEISTVIALSADGYQQLCRLLTARNLDDAFCLRHYAMANDLNGLLFFVRSPLLFQDLARAVPASNIFFLPAASQGDNSLWSSVTLPETACVFHCPDAWFLEETDRETFSCLARLRKLSGEVRYAESFQWPGIVLPDCRRWSDAYPEYAEIAERTLARCHFKFSFGKPLFPKLNLPGDQSPCARLRGLCMQRLLRKYQGRNLASASSRLDRELKVITDNGFADYFLYVYEIIRFAKQQNIPAGVRGSAASSLVSYLLGFTECCPLENDLFFERFMNPGRRDCPDIDIDIADYRRDEVIEFCYRNWGDEHVAMIATVLKYRHRSAIRDAGRVLDLSQSQVDGFLNASAICPEQTRLLEIAGKLIGLPRHIGVHCGGVVITPCPLTDVAPLTRTAKGVRIVHYEKNQAETLGLLKMDLLGNSALSVLHEAGKLLDNRSVKLNEPGPCYDFKVNRLFANGDTLGVYQCESPGMRQLCSALKPASQKEVAIALSLIRPGPAAAGMKEAFVRRRRGEEPILYLHPRMANFLRTTYGVMLYQEDVMKVAVNLAGYTVADADDLRRTISSGERSSSIEREQHRFVFKKAAQAGIPDETAQEIWNQVAKFASYSYCKAHASVYGRLAWLTARMKAHYPREFYTAVLNHHKSMYPKRVFVWDAIRHGIPVFPININRSELQWTAMANGIAAGFSSVRGLRNSLCRRIVSERKKRVFLSLNDLRRRVSFRKGELEKLVLLNACRQWGSRKELLQALNCSDTGFFQPALFNTAASETTLPDLMYCEMALTGIPFCRHPVERSEHSCMAVDLWRARGGNVWMQGIVDAWKHVKTSDSSEADPKMMSFITLEDVSGLFEVVLFPEQHQRYFDVFNTSGPLQVYGKVVERWDSVCLELISARQL